MSKLVHGLTLGALVFGLTGCGAQQAHESPGSTLAFTSESENTTTTRPSVSTTQPAIEEDPAPRPFATFAPVGGREPESFAIADAVGVFSTEFGADADCVGLHFEVLTADELGIVGIDDVEVSDRMLFYLTLHAEEPVFDAVLLALAQCSPEIDSWLFEWTPAHLDDEVRECIADAMSSDADQLAANLFGTTGGQDPAEVYPKAAYKRMIVGVGKLSATEVKCIAKFS